LESNNPSLYETQSDSNRDPHVHVHIVPRFDPDPAPSMPLPEAAWIHSTALSDSELSEQVDALRIAVESA
jgi:diadenosine tetraphosphate (Ap4A) HIT family hydrolase